MTLSAFLSVIVLLAIGFVALYVLSIYLKYRKSSYYDESGISFLKILFASKIGTDSIIYIPETLFHVPEIRNIFRALSGRSDYYSSECIC